MLTTTQAGTAGEQLFAACVTLSSGGDLELFKPLTDDDHTDVTAGRRGKVPALAIQVKTSLSLDPDRRASARMTFPDGKPREHPTFVYAIVYVSEASIERAWVIPSADFNRLTTPGAGPRGKGIQLHFEASPSHDDRWATFRCSRLELGPQLMKVIDGLPAGSVARVPRVPGAHFLLRRDEPRGARRP
jgi:hypothetical protein